MGWFWQEARGAAAREFGSRHYRGILAWTVFRHLAGPMFIVAVLVLAVGAAWRWYPAWSAYLVPVVMVGGTLAVLGLIFGAGWRRWGWWFQVRPVRIGWAVTGVTLGLATLATLGMFVSR